MIYTHHHPPHHHHHHDHDQVEFHPVHPFAFMIVSELSSVRLPSTSIIRHHHPLPPVHPVLPVPFPPHPPPHDQGQISIDLFHCIDVRGYMLPFTHAAPHHPAQAVPLAEFHAQPHHHSPVFAHHTHHHVCAGCNKRVVAVPAVAIPLATHAQPVAPLALKLNVRLVKSAFPLIFICTTHHVGVTVHVLVVDHAVHEEKFLVIYVLFDHVIVKLASHCTQSADVPQNLLFMNHAGTCQLALSNANFPLSPAPLDVETNMVVSVVSISRSSVSAPHGFITVFFNQSHTVNLASSVPVVVSLTVIATF